MNKFIVALIILLMVFIAYGLYERDSIEGTHHVIGSAHVGSSVRVIQLSDLHLRKADARAQMVVTQVREQHPDVIVLTGDVIDHPESMPTLEAFLQALDDIPKIAILGNWEYWSKINLHELNTLYARHHTELLVNSCKQLKFKGRSINFVGLDDSTASHANLRKATFYCPNDSDSILLEHSPTFFGKSLDTPVAVAPFLLSLSGHTHGGQVTFFGSPLILPPGSGPFTSGLYSTKYGVLYVSRGIDTSELPLRVGARPEIAVFELR
jgi:predicted MPP superfamily phosphohydrolase